MRSVIGIDLGGTSIYGGIINEKGEILKRAERETGTGLGKKEVLNRISEVINELLMGEIVYGIGIGTPGFIDSEQGKVLSIGGNIEDWAGTNIKGELSKVFKDIPIFVENDANVAGICESWIGAGKSLKTFVMITLGTGVGGAIYTSKEGIWHGHRYQGAELGHVILYPKGRPCNCGQYGCVERYISGRAVEELYKEKTGIEKKGRDIFKESISDQVSMNLIDDFAENLAIYIVSLKNIFDPEGIIIGGGVINSKEYWWNKTLEYYQEYSNDPVGMEILPAIYLNDAGMIGAAKVVLDKIK